MNAVHTVWLGRQPLRLDDLVTIAERPDAIDVRLAPETSERLQAKRALIDQLSDEARPVYGVTTGFGALAQTRIPAPARRALQHALVRSHAAGMGAPLPRPFVRAMMLARANSLAQGYSGVRPVVIEQLLALLRHDIIPYVPRYGSLGASGDLAPLAHIALCLTGEGWILGPDNTPQPTAPALIAHGIEPLVLEAKEGLALVNGTDGMAALLALACAAARRLFKTADVACAMSVESLFGTDRPFAPEIQALRPHPGALASAANIRRLLANSGIVRSHRDSPHLVQDAYSLRCHAQVAGAARDTLTFAEDVLGRELGAAVDNPVILDDGRVESTGNFHGEPLAFAADFLSIAVAEIGAIAERRIDRLLDPTRSQGLPAFLTPEPGVNSGLMIAHYTAAALAAECRRLAQPASVESLPTSAMQEDHVSMGWNAALKLHEALDCCTRILAVEILAATYGQVFRRPLEPAAGTGAVAQLVLDHVPPPGPDLFLAPILATVEELVREGAVLAAAERAIGPLA